jgi:glycosyltransferase involved in cell wall biosynthesis
VPFADLRIGSTRGRFVVAWLSRLDVEKGEELALHVPANLGARGVDAELWLAGSGLSGSSSEAGLKARACALDLGHTVRLVGSLPSLAAKSAFFRSADAFLATFIRPEPFGLVVTEAMACGLPVVVPNSGGPREVARSAGLGALAYTANDTGEASRRLEGLARDPGWRLRAGELARMSFATRWNVARTAEALETLFPRARPTWLSAHRPPETVVTVGDRDGGRWTPGL